MADAYQSDPEGKQISPEFHENEFVILKPDQSVKKTLLGRVSGGKIVPLVYKKSKPYGVSPRNVGQYFMQEALMTSAEEAPLVILKASVILRRIGAVQPVDVGTEWQEPQKHFIRSRSEWKKSIIIQQESTAV